MPSIRPRRPGFALARPLTLRRLQVAVLALLPAVLLGACAAEPPPAPPACGAQAYSAAVRDAAAPTAADVSTALWPITPANPRLVWTADQSAVRMVTWTGWGGYAIGDTRLSQDVWLTAVPQLQTLCQGTPADRVAARVQEILGMPPADASDLGNHFVEMWVLPADLFRPCPDAEIDDTSCDLAFPASATAEHRAWMNATYASSYAPWQGMQYPWTALGYTYDWCNPSTKVGASEFVVRAGATVAVTGVYPHDAYCLP